MSTFHHLFGDPATVLSPVHRATHTWVVGQPGTGKSRALESWALQDIASGQGVTVIDPHGDLFHNLLCYLATRPELAERVVILDPCDRDWVVSFNPLESFRGLSPERVALFLTDVVVKIWKLDATSTPRLVWLLTNTFLALADLKLTLLDLPRFLVDTTFRERMLLRLKNEVARAYFDFEFPKTQGAVHQWVTPALNKIAGLVFDPDMRLMLAGQSTLNFREVLDKKLVLLVHLPKGLIGEGASALLGAFIVAQLQKAALSRADSLTRDPYYLYLDEFQNYTTDNIRDILSESRKYGLSLILAHQYLDQLAQELRSSVLNTTGTLVCFRVGYHDAYQLAKEMFPASDFLTTSETRLRQWRWPLVTLEERHKPLGWEGLAQCLTSLKLREFWVRKRGPYPPEKLHSLTLPQRVMTPELAVAVQRLRDASGGRFGRWKRRVARAVAAPRSGFVRGTARDYAEDEREVAEIPLWGN